MAAALTKPRKWTAAEIAYLKRNAGKKPYEAIAAALKRSRNSVQSCAKSHGLTTRHFWTARQIAILKEHNGKLPIDDLCRQLKRTRSSVYGMREKLGLTTPTIDFGDKFIAFLKVKHALGWSDTEIAAGYSKRFTKRRPIDRHSVSERRRKLGLCDNSLSQHRRQKVAAKTAEQLRQAGLPSIGYLRVEAFKKRARDAGWPEDIRPRAVQILNALWDHGPMTRIELAAVIGMPWKGSRRSLHSNDPEGSYLAHLMKRGLVITLGRIVRGKGRGHSTQIYSLPLWIQRGQRKAS